MSPAFTGARHHLFKPEMSFGPMAGIREFVQTLNEDGVAISRVFPAGTILITIAANIGFTGILQFDSACPDSLVAITPNQSLNVEFLEYFLQTQQEKMDKLAPKGTQKNINIQFLTPWPTVVPPDDEQSEIVAILEAVDRKIDLHPKKTRGAGRPVQSAAAQADDGQNSRHRSRPLSTTMDLQFIAKAEKRKQWQISFQIP